MYTFTYMYNSVLLKRCYFKFIFIDFKLYYVIYENNHNILYKYNDISNTNLKLSNFS